MNTISKVELNKKIELHKKWLNKESGGERLVLIGYDLSDSNLSNSDLRHSDLGHSDLRHSDLSNSNLSNSDLSNSDLSNSYLSNSNLSNSDLSNSDLSSSNLRHSDLRHSDLRYSDLSSSDLRHSDLTGANIDFSCWPLWCGSLGVKLDKKRKRQLGYHFADTLDDNDPEEKAIKEVIKDFVNGFHRIKSRECEEIK